MSQYHFHGLIVSTTTSVCNAELKDKACQRTFHATLSHQDKGAPVIGVSKLA